MKISKGSARLHLPGFASGSVARTGPLVGWTGLRGITRAALGVLALLGLGAPGAAAQPGAAAGTKAAPPAASRPTGTASSGEASLMTSPPSGEYEITTSIITNSCGDKRTAPEPSKAVVYTKAAKKGLLGNLPLPSLARPQDSKSGVVERSDLPLKAGEKVVSTSTPDPLCPSYKTTRTLELLEVTPDRIKLRRTEEHGAAGSCPKPPLLTSCALIAEQVFTLKKAM